ncbi:MAG: CRISPR-associated endonuclease Cas2 [Tannerellaceae bacterium]
MSELRLNAYHVMWLFVFFDLPVTTKKERKVASQFRLFLEKQGFMMMQFSVYIRHCGSKEAADVHIRRVKTMIPISGKVSILMITDKQFGDILNYVGRNPQKSLEKPVQLEFF